MTNSFIYPLIGEVRAGTLFDSPKYKKFISERDKALERVHLNAQIDITRLLGEMLDRIKKDIVYLALYIDSDTGIQFARLFDQQTQKVFHEYLPRFVRRVEDMRRGVYLLSYLGEQEAIGRATKIKKQQTSIGMKAKIKDAVESETILGQDLEKRIWASLMSLQSRIVKRFRNAVTQELPAKEFLAEVELAFPKLQTYKRPPRELKPFREATKTDQNDDQEFNFDFTDQEDWDQAINQYMGTELPPSRFDNIPSIEDGHAQFNWEVEQDLTDDFVNQVRSGQVDAANELGIQEFVWVAILDNRTDDCCSDRNGMTTSEIETALANGNMDADTCDASTPPAHPNCRCQLAPVASTDEVEGPDWKSFNDWLES